MSVIFIHMNQAKETFNFLSALGLELEKEHDVIYILESKFCFKKFSAFFVGKSYEIWPSCSDIQITKNNFNLDLNKNYWEYLYPDIDRENWLGISSGRDIKWYQSYIYVSLHWLETIFMKYDVNAIIYEQFTTAPAFLLGEVAKKHGVKYFGLQQSRIPGRFEIHNEKYSFIDLVKTNYQRVIDQNLETSSEEKYQEILKYKKEIKNIEPTYMKPTSHYIGSFTQLLRSRFLENLLFLVRNNNLCSYQIPSPIRMYIYGFLNKVKRIVNNKYYLRYTGYPESIKYILYPLQYHPEASTSVFAKNYDNELNTIKQIAFNLPMNYILYVKEHRAALGIRDKKFYREISKLPNVNLIRHDADTKELIHNSSGVITLTSTVGYEAVILGKPVIVLGRVFYEHAYGVYRPNKWDDIFSIIKNEIGNFIPDEEKIIKFLLSYWMSIYEGNVFIGGSEDSDNIGKIARTLNELL